MPNEWDAYLLRMGRKAEIGAGAASEFDLNELCWTEVESANEGVSNETAPKDERRKSAMKHGRNVTSPANIASGPISGPNAITPSMEEGQSKPEGADIAANANQRFCTEKPSAEFRQASHAREHVARSFPERARQFMPFAALKGYEEMLAEVERDAMLAAEGRTKKRL